MMREINYFFSRCKISLTWKIILSTSINPKMKFDHIILGTGQATGTLLGKLIPTGDSIAVIEGNEIGGSCVNYGCTPTKAMVASAKAIFQARAEELMKLIGKTKGKKITF